jgi:hypothetical protein
MHWCCLMKRIFFSKNAPPPGPWNGNAFVSAMLRVVEYFKGVLFLTSNRVDEMDPAFRTRITLALRYEQLDVAARAQVWTNLLSASGFRSMIENGSIDPDELAKHVLNGREIKNAVSFVWCIMLLWVIVLVSMR